MWSQYYPVLASIKVNSCVVQPRLIPVVHGKSKNDLHADNTLLLLNILRNLHINNFVPPVVAYNIII